MKENVIFKSEEGRQKIFSHYRSLLKGVPFSFRESMVDTAYGETYVLEAGKPVRPAILLLHGSCSNSAMWFGDMGILAEHYNVLSVDILGEAGNSAAKRLNLNSDDYALWVRELMDSLSIHKAALMGNSYGGWMALKFATAFPERVSKIVLVATSGISPVKPSFLLKTIFYAFRGKKGRNAMNRLVYGTSAIPEEVLQVADMIMENFNPMVAALPIFGEERLKKLTMPVLYIAGENDVTVDAKKTAQRIRRLMPRSATVLLENHGHVVYDVMDRIMPFLQKG